MASQYPALRSMLTALSMDDSGYDRTLPDDACDWPPDAGRLEQIALSMDETDRLDVALGNGDRRDELIAQYPEAEALYAFFADVFDGPRQPAFYAPYEAPRTRQTRRHEQTVRQYADALVERGFTRACEDHWAGTSYREYRRTDANGRTHQIVVGVTNDGGPEGGEQAAEWYACDTGWQNELPGGETLAELLEYLATLAR